MLHKLTLMLVLSLIAVGCGANNPSPTRTPQPTDIPEDTPVPVQSEATEEALELSQGEVLFREFKPEAGFACVTCHYPDSDNRLIGPGFLTLKSRFEDYEIEVDELETYIHESIVDPEAFIAPGNPPFPENIMPRTYSTIFSEEEIQAIVDYILSL